MSKSAAMNAAGNALMKFLEHQTIPPLSAPTAEGLGKRYAEVITGMHAELLSYFQKIHE